MRYNSYRIGSALLAAALSLSSIGWAMPAVAVPAVAQFTADKSNFNVVVTIEGKPEVGQTLKIATKGLLPHKKKGAEIGYKWLYDGKVIDGVASNKLKIKDKYKGAKISAVVTAEVVSLKASGQYASSVQVFRPQHKVGPVTGTTQTPAPTSKKCLVPANVVAVAVTPECPAGSVKWAKETTKETTPTNAPKNNPLTNPKATKAQIIAYLKPVCDLKPIDNNFYRCDVKSETGKQTIMRVDFRPEKRWENEHGIFDLYGGIYERGKSLAQVNSLARQYEDNYPGWVDILISGSQVEIGYGYQNGIPHGLRKLLPASGLKYWTYFGLTG